MRYRYNVFLFIFFLLPNTLLLAQSGRCVSGDCRNGKGIVEYDLGRYEGEFLNGSRHGRGVFTYTSGKLKGAVYTGEFANDAFNGWGRIDYTNTGSALLWQEGTWVKDILQGYGKRMQRNGTLYAGNFVNGHLTGLLSSSGSSLSGKLPVLGYWLAMNDTQGVPMEVLKYHHDTAFARFKKCNCLSPKKFRLSSWRWTAEKYDEYNALGDKVGEGTQQNLNLDNPEFSGFVNNTDQDIYIRGYFIKYYADRDVTEYEDGSYRLAPGEKAMGNYRLPPQPGQLYHWYFQAKFVYEGQYCDKDRGDCKTTVVNNNETSFSILAGMETTDKAVKKGARVSIRAKGSIVVGMFAGRSTPDGINGYESYNRVSGYKHGALLYRLGETGRWQLAGSSAEFVAETDGKIYFIVNDDDDSNNTGGYEITVSVK